MERIKDTLQKVMRGIEAKKKGLPADSPEALLKKFLTKKELKHIKFHYFKKGVLNLNIDSSAWLYHLSLKKEDLLTRLGNKNSSIRDICFRLGG